MYRVAWKDNETNESGHGSALSFEHATAWVISMNKKHPEMTHWVEEVTDQTEPTS